jgi:hypothetical protein
VLCRHAASSRGARNANSKRTLSALDHGKTRSPIQLFDTDRLAGRNRGTIPIGAKARTGVRLKVWKPIETESSKKQHGEHEQNAKYVSAFRILPSHPLWVAHTVTHRMKTHCHSDEYAGRSPRIQPSR